MEKKEILEKLQEIFRDVFDNDEIVVTINTVAEDIDEWDSLGHVQLIKEIQTQFSISITAQEMRSWEDVGEMADAIITKLG